MKTQWSTYHKKIKNLRSRVKMLMPLGFFLLIGVFLFRSLSLDPTVIPSALAGRGFPQFGLPRLEDGQVLSQEEFIGQSALINIWATWCAACVVEHSFLMSLAELDIPIFGVNYKDEPSSARSWLAASGNPYVFSVVDNEGRLGLDLGVYGAPETFFIDSNGIIRYRHVGIINSEIWESKLLHIYNNLDGVRTWQ